MQKNKVKLLKQKWEFKKKAENEIRRDDIANEK
jgi:hypothetical protein